MTGRNRPRSSFVQAPEESVPEAPAGEPTPGTEPEAPADEPEDGNVRVILRSDAAIQKFSGRGVRLYPGANVINADKTLMALLRRGERNGKWKLEKL